MTKDSPQYLQKKAFYQRLLTIYGRKPVLEALQDNSLTIHRLHLADSNKTSGIVGEIIALAEQRQIEALHHNRQSLARISKNSKQDQGVAADIHLEKYRAINSLVEQATTGKERYLALDRITNPQNLGMIIRSACAGRIDGIIIPDKGCASLSPLVIKASAGTLFKAPIVRCNTLAAALQDLKANGYEICGLSSHAPQSLFDYQPQKPTVYILGNESKGVDADIGKLSDTLLSIPMNNGVESLNVAVTAALIAFYR